MFVQEELVCKQEEAKHILVVVVPICKREVEITEHEQAKAIGYKLAIAVEHIQFAAVVEDDKLFAHQHHQHPDNQNMTLFSLGIVRISFNLEMVLLPSFYFISFHKVG